MKIIGIGGTNGSGKDTLSQILAQDFVLGSLSVSPAALLLVEALGPRWMSRTPSSRRRRVTMFVAGRASIRRKERRLALMADAVDVAAAIGELAAGR